MTFTIRVLEYQIHIPFETRIKTYEFHLKEWKSLNIVIKHVFICSNPYIYTTVVQEVYNRECSLEVDDVEGLAAAATKHMELLKQKDNLL